MRILVVRVGAMGDVLHGMPAVAALRSALPDAEIAWAVEPRWSPLLRAGDAARPRSAEMPLVDHVHLVPTKEWSKHPLSAATLRSVLSLRRELRSQRYDIAIDLQGSIRSAMIARTSGAAHVVGSASPREMQARWLYTQQVNLERAHVVEQALEIVSSAIGVAIKPQGAPLPVDTAAERWCDALLGADPRRVAFLAPTAGWGAKQWPADKFAALARTLGRAGLRVLVNQAGSHDQVAGNVIAASDGFADAADCTVSQMIALLRRCSLVVAGDTGPLHLAAALGVPVVALFGPTDPDRNGPWGAPARVLRRAKSITDHSRRAATEAGLASITVEEVCRAAGELLNLDITAAEETR